MFVSINNEIYKVKIILTHPSKFKTTGSCPVGFKNLIKSELLIPTVPAKNRSKC